MSTAANAFRRTDQIGQRMAIQVLVERLEAIHKYTRQLAGGRDAAGVRIARRDISYYSAPTSQKGGPKSLDDIDPELLRVYEKLGVPLQERERLAGVAVDAVFDSFSVGTTFKTRLAELGIIFGSFSKAVQEHPDLVRQYLGSVVPYTDNYGISGTRVVRLMG